jgi:glutamine amidotransferase
MGTSGLSEALVALAKGGKTSVLGICLGMQLLCESSTEDGWSRGLGLVPVAFEQFVRSEVEGRPIPHIGFSPTLFPQGREGIFRGLAEPTDFYFVHSYRTLPIPTLDLTATCDYGVKYLAGFDLGNICGTQFHPEKSQSQGLRLLRNFLERKL